MRLITHNLMICNVSACVESGLPRFPLKVVPSADEDSVETVESEFNKEFIVHMLPKLEWAALQATAASLKLPPLPDAIPPDAATDDAFLSALHTVLMDVHLKAGHLECPSCARQYPVMNGIPNMLLHEDEVVTGGRKKKSAGK